MTLIETRMSILAFMLLCVAALLLGVILGRTPQAVWVPTIENTPDTMTLSGHWECPAGYTVFADEREAREGKDNYVHCVK